MIYILLNGQQIFAATLAGLAVGAGYHWLSAGRVASTAPALPRRPAALVAVAFAAEFWLASILAGALILAPPEAGEWTMAIGSAVVIWVGFVLPVLAVTYLYRRQSSRLTILDAGHWLLVMLVQAAVLQSLGLSPPPAA